MHIRGSGQGVSANLFVFAVASSVTRHKPTPISPIVTERRMLKTVHPCLFETPWRIVSRMSITPADRKA